MSEVAAGDGWHKTKSLKSVSYSLRVEHDQSATAVVYNPYYSTIAKAASVSATTCPRRPAVGRLHGLRLGLRHISTYIVDNIQLGSALPCLSAAMSSRLNPRAVADVSHIRQYTQCKIGIKPQRFRLLAVVRSHYLHPTTLTATSHDRVV